MDGSGAISTNANLVAAASAGGQIATSLVAQSFSSEKAQIATLFSTIGLGKNVDATA